MNLKSENEAMNLNEMNCKLAEYQAKIEKINKINTNLTVVLSSLKSTKESYENYLKDKEKVLEIIGSDFGLSYRNDKTAIVKLNEVICDYIVGKDDCGAGSLDNILNMIVEAIDI